MEGSEQRRTADYVAQKYHPPRGKMALYSGVEEAMRALGDAEFGDTIYVVTDGGENLSAISQRRLVQNLITDGIRTFVFLVNTSDFKTPEECEGSHNMEELAGQTGVSPRLAEEWVSDVSLRLWRSKSSVQRPRLMRSILSSIADYQVRLTQTRDIAHRSTLLLPIRTAWNPAQLSRNLSLVL